MLLASEFSCNQKKETIPLNKALKLDSTFTWDSITYKYLYEGDKIKELNRYFLNYPSYPEKLIGKVVYSYSGDKIIEKQRYFFPSGNTLTQTLNFYYDTKGKIIEIKMTKLNQVDPWTMKFDYTGDNLSKVYFLGGATSFEYDSKGNILRSDLNYDDYSYQTSNDPNPFLFNNFFLEEYNLSNLEMIDILNLPVYFNKQKVLSIKKNNILYRSFTTSLLDKKVTYFKINEHDWLTGQIKSYKEFEFFYK